MNWDNLRDSARDFKQIVWPEIQKWFGDGELIPVEAVTESEMAKKLDMYSGIDAWYIQEDSGIRGIGSRVQWGDDYRTFTIRKEKFNRVRTEFEKLCNAIDNDWLYPYWFTQAYLTDRNGRLLSVATAKTEDIIKYIKEIDCPVRPTDDAWFYYIEWSLFAQKYPIRIWLPLDDDGSLPSLIDFMRPPGGVPSD